MNLKKKKIDKLNKKNYQIWKYIGVNQGASMGCSRRKYSNKPFSSMGEEGQ